MRAMTITGMRSVAAQSEVLLLPAFAGFFFVFRVSLVFLFFQADPVVATELSVLAGVGLVVFALLSTAGERPGEGAGWLKITTLRWIGAYLALSLASLAWTGAAIGAAVGYWTAMCADVAAVLLMLRKGSVLRTAESLLMGAVWGGVVLAAVGWCAPATEDMRLGNVTFLHPNTLGLEIGLAALMAQYLARRGAMWKWLAIGLAITLLRTLSKTAILAFLMAEVWYVLQSRHWTRAAKVRIAVAAGAVVACFWGLLSAYADIYVSSGRGDQLETLTGRTVLWAVAGSMALAKPWLGHGFYSFKSLIPALGAFEPVHAHNELLEQFFEYGVAGVAVVLAIYSSFLWLARRARESELRTLAIALLIFAVVRGLTDAVVAELSYPLWLMTALAICLSQRASGEAVRA